jgi:hypothetical protein
VLVGQDLPEVAIHRRTQAWASEVISGPTGRVPFRSISLTLALADIYADLRQGLREPDTVASEQ